LQWYLRRAIVSLRVTGSQVMARALNVVTLPLPFGPARPRPDRSLWADLVTIAWAARKIAFKSVLLR